MNFLELVRKRYSLRKYAPRPVGRAALERCIEAARLAPSACNSQPWRFIVVESTELRERLAETAFSGIYKMNQFACRAPVLVVMIRETSGYAARLGGTLRGVPYSLIDLGIAGEHFALQAAEEGLGTCWLGWFNERAVKNILGLNRRTRVDILFSVGHPEEGADLPEKKRKAAAEMCEYR
ncbi:MAG: nitroreductase family protein [Kiritimatiellae bacterium]|nr:nitroreductase family protein [Kiritimatiellia bacterium]MDD4735208.1 nitroreductase family protein [Kiritimatiellia bacterium]